MSTLSSKKKTILKDFDHPFVQIIKFDMSGQGSK